jgi:excisionase family DNA binding protein
LEEKSFVSIKEASNLLGVSEVALRHWTDEGKIEAFITPGGHRRYSKEGLNKLKNMHQNTLKVEELMVELEGTTSIHREISRSFLNTSRYSQLSRDAQERLASSGMHLLKLIKQYVSDTGKREEINVLAGEIGRNFGQELAEMGMPLANSVEAFISHRSLILGAATELMNKRKIYTENMVGLIPLISQVMDEALVSLIRSYQKYPSRTLTLAKGENGR